jgi:hypothetical protein
MFRVKLVRETRDGRVVNGNFPPGAGALWIHWDEVVFESHLKNISRPEVKEYCRYRQRQLDEGETPEERVANEIKALHLGQMRVASLMATGSPAALASVQPTLAIKGAATNGNGYDDASEVSGLTEPKGETPAATDSRPTRRVENGVRPRQSLPDVELRAANRPPGSSILERTNDIARREILRVEAAAERAEQRNLNREQSAAPQATANKMQFQDNVQRLNKVWAAQEANRLKGGVEDAKIYMGVKYERKQTGPFEGKLVSQGTIISIEGEDYVEYRVLTKPSFF